MTPLYNELYALAFSGIPSNPDGAMNAIKTAAMPDLPRYFCQEMRNKTARFILPEKPDGMEFSKDCFWREFQQKFIWHRMWCGTPEQKRYAAEWLKSQRETALRRNKQWPPNPLPFRQKVAIPQPLDGKDEKPGRLPRTGKD